MKTTLKTIVFALISIVIFSSCNDEELKQQKLNEAVTSALNERFNQSDSVSTKHFSEPININITEMSSGELQAHWITAIVAIGVMTPFITIVIIILLIVRFNIKKVQSRNRIIEKALDNNTQLPEEFFNESKKSKTRLQSALVWIAWGVGIAIVLFVLQPEDAGPKTSYIIGCIPFLVGIAKLITYFVEDRNNNQEEDAE